MKKKLKKGTGSWRLTTSAADTKGKTLTRFDGQRVWLI